MQKKTIIKIHCISSYFKKRSPESEVGRSGSVIARLVSHHTAFICPFLNHFYFLIMFICCISQLIEKTQLFHSHFMNTYNQHAPIKVLIRKATKTREKPWLTSAILKSIQTKRKLLLKYHSKEDLLEQCKNHWSNVKTKLERENNITLNFSSECNGYNAAYNYMMPIASTILHH